MKLDENVFHRQMTMRICSSLDIEKALWQCLDYLRNVMPADRMYLHLWERESASVRTLAMATQSSYQTMDLFTQMNPEAMAHLELLTPPYVRMVNDPERDPVSRIMVHALDEASSSRLIMRLNIESKRLEAVALTAEGNNRYSEEHLRLFSLLNRPFSIAMSNYHRHQELLQLKDLLADENEYLYREIQRLSGEEIVGSQDGLKKVMGLVEKIGPLDSPALILGETGTGKNLIAQAIHNLSPRRDKPFIKVDCGALPETIIDSELFGHEKGAFTGAVSQKRGRFERADGGTIFLDEIGELSPQAQVRMLRVIQAGEIERVGGSGPINVDIRIIAATHRDLRQMTKQGEFRQDLWFRLNVFPISVPSLRERRDDIFELTRHFIEKKAKELKIHPLPKLAPGTVERMVNYAWPGNVRELENIVERCLILDRHGPLNFEPFLPSGGGEGLPGPRRTPEGLLTLDELTVRHIEDALSVAKGKIHGPGGAAALLGVNPSTLRNKMNKYNIPYGKRRQAMEV